jgi:stage II sporulation protein D
MRPPRSAVRVSLGLVLLQAVATCTSPSVERPPESRPSTTAPSTSPSPPGRPEVPGRTRLTIPDGGSFLLRIRYPTPHTRCLDPPEPVLTTRYPGTLVVTRTGDGSLSATLTLPFERYLEGIAEVPPTWPRAALEAQAIAARSYALASTGWSGAQGETLREPICATSSCQVYAGIPVPREPVHRRWVRAVRRTSGSVLLYQGRPADTVYFSTSNGRTYGNDEVFGSAPLPYLRPVVERDDGASPTSRWRVRIAFRDLTRFLRAADAWPRGRTIREARVRGDEVVLRGGGARRSVDAANLADAVNVWAPCLEPHRYPGALPATIPSRWLTVSVSRRALVVEGRGWGHGVGMVQWGAFGKARRGLSADQILAYYYGGLRPRPYPEPGLIHVQVVTGAMRIRVVPSRAGAEMNGRALERPVVIEGGLA